MSSAQRSIGSSTDTGARPDKPAGATSAAVRVRREPTDHVVADLVQRSQDGNAALMRGDSRRYFELVGLADDFLLMSPFGGTPSRAADYTDERIDAMGRFFSNGTFRQEVLETYASADLVVLAVIERAHVAVGGLPAQDWALRVTLVYRREGSRWRLAHRHADPLVAGISVTQAAALARGELPSREA